MKLATFATAIMPKPRLGLVVADEIVDVDLAGRALNVPHPPEQMFELLDQQEDGLKVLQAILKKAAGRRLSEVLTFSEIGAAHSLTEVQLFAPIPRPRKNIMCLGLNYAEHAKESAEAKRSIAEQLSYPLIFTKATTTVNAPYGNFVIEPQVSSKIDWEVELAVIIGKSGKNIREEDALSYIFGYTVINDITARDIQERHKQYFKGKSLDGSAPMGPWIVTTDEIPDPQQLSLRLRVNGVTKQDGNTSDMIFTVRQIIATLSLGMTLEAGDIIATGTPSGVGFARTPAEFLQTGDVMETEIVGIGILKTSMI